MNSCFFSDLPDYFHQKRPLLLTVLFLLGHLLGVWVSGHASESLFSAMRTALGSPVSIVGLLSTLMLPLLISAFAVYLAQPILLFPIAFWKAFLFSYIGFGLISAWGSAGWLVVLLMMGSRMCAMAVYYWYWLRHIGGAAFQWGTFGAALVVLLLIGIVHWYFIEPFLARIITF